jgi:hypothetical protein
MSILKSANLMELCVLTHCMQCPDITVIACLTMLLELDNVNNNAVEGTVSFVSSRTSTDVFLHLALDIGNVRVCPLFPFAMGAYCEACS